MRLSSALLASLPVVFVACSAVPSESVGSSAAAIHGQPDVPPGPPGPPGRPPAPPTPPTPRDAGASDALVDAASPKPVADAAVVAAPASDWVYARLVDTQECASVRLGADGWIASFTFGADSPRFCTFAFVSASGAAASSADRTALSEKLQGAWLFSAACGAGAPCGVGAGSLVATGAGVPMASDSDGGSHEGGISCGACAPVATVIDKKIRVVLPPWLVHDAPSIVNLVAPEMSVTIEVPASTQVLTVPLDAVAPSAAFTLYYMPSP